MKFNIKVVQEFQLLIKGVRPSTLHKVDRCARFICKVVLPFPPTAETIIRREGCTFDIGPFCQLSWDEEGDYFFCKQKVHVWNHDEGTSFIQAVDNYKSEEGWNRID